MENKLSQKEIEMIVEWLETSNDKSIILKREECFLVAQPSELHCGNEQMQLFAPPGRYVFHRRYEQEGNLLWPYAICSNLFLKIRGEAIKI